MANNVTLDPTTTSGGAVISTEELSDGSGNHYHYQQIKVGYGDAGSFTSVSTNNPLPVSVGGTLTVAGSGTFITSDGAVVNALAGTLAVSVGNTVTVTGTITANAGTGTQSVSDGAVVSALGGIIDVSDGAVVGAINNVTTANALRVNIDSTNIAIGGGTQYSVGTSGIASAGTGNLMIAARDDALSALASGEGEVIPLRVDANGALWTLDSSSGATATALNEVTTAGAFRVNIDSSNVAIGGGTQYSVGTSGIMSAGTGNLMIATRDSTLSSLANNDGEAIPLRVDGFGALWTLDSSSGATATALNEVTTAGAFRVNIDSTNVAIGGGTQYSVGTSGVASAGIGNLMIGVRDDALSALASGEGQAIPLRVDNQGALWVVAAPGDAETTDGATVASLGVTRQVNVGFISVPNELTVGANNIGMAGMTENREIYTSVRDFGNSLATAGALQVHVETSNVAFGGGTQYSVGTSNVASAGTGTLMIATRDEKLSPLASGEGEAVGARVDSVGALWVNADSTNLTHIRGNPIDSGVGSSSQGTLRVTIVTNQDSLSGWTGLSTSDGAVVTAINNVTTATALRVNIDSTNVAIGGGTQYSVGTSDLVSNGIGNLMIAVRDDALTALASGEGEGVPLRVSSTGALHVTGGGGGTQFNEDAALGATPEGTLAMARRDNSFSAGATLTPIEGDAVSLRVDPAGALYTHTHKAGSVIDSGNTTAGTIAAEQ
jgi:hypothetical protein